MEVRTGTSRSAVVGGAVMMATAVVGVAALRADRELPPGPADLVTALEVLAAARGASPFACELMVALLSPGWRGGFGQEPDAPANALPRVHWILERSTDAARIAPLRRGLEDPDPCVRRMAPRLLARSDHPQAVEALLQALRSPNPAARRSAAVGLGYASDPRAVDALRHASSDEHPEVRTVVAWALARLRATSPPNPAPIHRGRRAALARSADGAVGSRPPPRDAPDVLD